MGQWGTPDAPTGPLSFESNLNAVDGEDNNLCSDITSLPIGRMRCSYNCLGQRLQIPLGRWCGTLLKGAHGLLMSPCSEEFHSHYFLLTLSMPTPKLALYQVEAE
jgi:hypothetical protein